MKYKVMRSIGGGWWWINKVSGGFPCGSLFCFQDEKTARAVCKDLNRHA